MNQKGKNVPSPEAASCLIDSALLLADCEAGPGTSSRECWIIRYHNANCNQGETEHLVWNKGTVLA